MEGTEVGDWVAVDGPKTPQALVSILSPLVHKSAFDPDFWLAGEQQPVVVCARKRELTYWHTGVDIDGSQKWQLVVEIQPFRTPPNHKLYARFDLLGEDERTVVVSAHLFTVHAERDEIDLTASAAWRACIPLKPRCYARWVPSTQESDTEAW